MHILVTRPVEDAEGFAAALRAHGHRASIDPMLVVRHLEGPALDLTGAQALVMTSANGVRAFAARDANRTLPVYAVGDATARAARDAGFRSVTSATGDVDALAALVARALDPDKGAVFHAAAGQVAGDLGGALTKAGFEYRRAVLYETRPATALKPETVAALQGGSIDAVALFSPRTAATFAGLAAAAGIEKALARVRALCLSQAVAKAVGGLPWAAVAVAARPDQDSLLAVLDGL